MAHIDNQLFYKTIVPMLSVLGTCLLGLSSPDVQENYFSTLLNLKKENGQPFFQVVNCFQICSKCMKLEQAKAYKCNHIKSSAHWLSQRAIKDLKSLYKSDPATAIRELGGVSVSDYKPALRKEEVQRCFAMQPFITQHSPALIFTCADPSGGGPSQLAIVSGYFTRLGDVVIIGLDAEPVRDEKEEYMALHRHYNKLNENKLWREAKKIFIPENNLGMEAMHMDSMVKDIAGVETFWEKPNKPGVCKAGKNSREYQFLLSNCLANGGLYFDRDCFTVTREKTVQCMKDQLQEQMLRYHFSVKKAPDESGRDRVHLTAKMGSLQDDLLIATMMVIYWGRVVTNEKGL